MIQSEMGKKNATSSNQDERSSRQSRWCYFEKKEQKRFKSPIGK